MKYLAICVGLLGSFPLALPEPAVAQFLPVPPPPGSPPVSSPPPGSATAPRPEPAKPPAEPKAQRQLPKPRPSQPPAARAKPNAEEIGAPGTARKPPPRQPADVVACSDLFGRDSNHGKLVSKYGAPSVAYGEVVGWDASKLRASILFPNDPKRRLEVLWMDHASRSGISVIAINGNSEWVAPKGLKLGLPLTSLEKINGRPFKLTGFGAAGVASVLGWENGELTTLPGGCNVGVRLTADHRAPAAVLRALSADREFLSSDATVRAAIPTVVEILIGY